MIQTNETVKPIPLQGTGWSAAFVALALFTGCSPEIDYDDELGLELGPESGYELVVIDGEETQTDALQDSAVEAEVQASGSDLDELIHFGERGEFTVQVGLYSSAREAGVSVRNLSAHGYPAYAITAPSGKGFRVRIGYFPSRQIAQRFGEIFKKDRGVEY